MLMDWTVQHNKDINSTQIYLYKFSGILIKIPGRFFYRYRQAGSKIYKGNKWTRVVKNFLKRIIKLKQSHYLILKITVKVSNQKSMTLAKG